MPPVLAKPVAERQRKVLLRWKLRAAEAVQNAMIDRDLSYEALAERLDRLGFPIAPKTLANRIKRGDFSMALGLLMIHAAGGTNVRVMAPSERFFLPRKPRP